MKRLVTRLDRWLMKNRPAFHAILLPGLSASEIKDFERLLGFRLPQPWKDLYRWRNGQPSDAPPEFHQAFQHNQSLLPLESVKYSYSLLTGMLDNDFSSHKNWWNSNWIPFLKSPSGDHECLDLEGAFRGKPGQVVSFWHAGDSRTITFPSLEAWLETYVVALEAEMWQEDDTGFQPKDEDDWYKLIKKLNPGYPKYKRAQEVRRTTER